MKRGLIIFSALVFLIANCRKKELKDFTTYEDLGVIHCSNGVLDSTEIGLDCGGGACSPCVQLDVPCVIPDNTLKEIQNSHTFTDNKTITELSNGAWQFKAYTNSSDYLTITFPGKPDVTKFYSNSEADVEYSQYAGQHLYGEGDVYVNYNNGVYTLSDCNCDFEFYGSTANFDNIDQHFKVTFD